MARRLYKRPQVDVDLDSIWGWRSDENAWTRRSRTAVVVGYEPLIAGVVLRAASPTFRRPRPSRPMTHVQNLHPLRLDAKEDSIPITSNDFDTDAWIGTAPGAERMRRDILDRRVYGVNDVPRAVRAARVKVAKNLVEIGERQFAIANLHATPYRFQKAATTSSDASPLRRAASIAAISTALSA